MAHTQAEGDAVRRLYLLQAVLLSGLICLAACRTTPTSVYTPPSEQDRDTATAERLTRQAAKLLDSKPERAEVLLRKALAADLYHGPAHNNLGVVFLGRQELYEAAHEFECALE